MPSRPCFSFQRLLWKKDLVVDKGTIYLNFLKGHLKLKILSRTFYFTRLNENDIFRQKKRKKNIQKHFKERIHSDTCYLKSLYLWF
jgi:hypothetical protein